MGDPERPAADGGSGDPPPCSEGECAAAADFRLYDRDVGRWRPVCECHARHVHPSTEVRAWLESGYLKPVELGPPEDPPGDPPGPRADAFRDLIDRAMGWSGSNDHRDGGGTE